MQHPNGRRIWLKQSATALIGLGLAPQLLAGSRENYAPGQEILLNSNENAYGPSPLARKAFMDQYLHSNRYPDNLLPQLKQKIAAHWKVAPENILLGAGASEIIGLACLYASKKNSQVLTGEPSYKVWNGQAAAFGLKLQTRPLDSQKCLDLMAIFGSVTADTGMVYICNPNNPTGTINEVKAVGDYALAAAARGTLVFIDEAYGEYAGLESLATLAAAHKNILVAKTFSKIYGLAGARVGYAIAHPELIRDLSQYQPWPDADVSWASAAAAMASLDDHGFVTDCREKARLARKLCYETFKAHSLEYIESHTNFVLFDISSIKKDFIKEMQVRNIFVQFREHFGGKWCRVTMGTLPEMQAFTRALGEILA